MGGTGYEPSTPPSHWSRDDPISPGGPMHRPLPPLPSYAAVLPPVPTLSSRTSPGPQSNMVNSSALHRAHALQGPLSSVTSSSMPPCLTQASIHSPISPPRVCHSPPSSGLQSSRDCRIEGEPDPQSGQCVVRHSSSIAALRLKAKEHAVAMGMVRAYNMRADV